MRQRLPIVLVVAAATLAPPTIAGTTLDLAALVAHAALALAALGLAEPHGGAWRTRFVVLAGALATSAFPLRASAWVDAFGTLAFGFGAVALLPSWRDVARDRALGRDAAITLGVAASLPALFAAVAAIAGTFPMLAREVAIAMPRRPLASVAFGATATLAVVLALDGLRARHSDARLVARACGAAIAAAIAARVAWIASVATLPSEAFWPEAPLLVNALKLDAGAALYGPPEELASYTYSPLLDLVHHAILGPLRAELSIYAHRTIVAAEQLAAIAVLVTALRGRAPAPALLAVALAALANLLAPALHPDHALLLCFAVAIALVVAERRWPRALWWIALVLVTPIATAFKLSGAGIGLGLAVAFAAERRWRAVAVLAASGALTLATVPLFDATLGRFRFYAMTVQASHPIVWSRAAELPSTPAGLAAIGALALHLWVRARASLEAQRAFAIVACVSLASLPAYLKYGGRDNNVALVLLGAVLVAVLRAHDARGDARAPHPTLVPSFALLTTLLFRPPAPPPDRVEREAAIADLDRVVATVRDADARGARALLLVHSTAWIAAGHTDVPRDRFHSAVELFYGSLPEADLLFSHVEDGRYDTIVATTAQLRPGDDLLGRLCARLRASIERGYDRVWPSDDRSLDAVDGVVVFRRRAR